MISEHSQTRPPPPSTFLRKQLLASFYWWRNWRLTRLRSRTWALYLRWGYAAAPSHYERIQANPGDEFISVHQVISLRSYRCNVVPRVALSWQVPLSTKSPLMDHLWDKLLLHTSKGWGNCLSGVQQIWEWNLSPKPQFSLDTTWPWSLFLAYLFSRNASSGSHLCFLL